MLVGDKHYKTLWMENHKVFMIDQNLLPFEFKVISSEHCETTCSLICDMTVRGAGAIGAAAAFAMAQAIYEAPQGSKKDYVKQCKKKIESTRPTAKNLFYATQRVYDAYLKSEQEGLKVAQDISNENEKDALAIGKIGSELIHDGDSILTHCNAGWLGFVDYGSALSPIYYAWQQGKKLFVYADETRPRCQGSKLTAWELFNQKIPHTIIPDNAAAYLMWNKKINLVIVGADRIAANGDTANKIGTFEKAILAKEFGIPFYVAAPGSTFDLNCPNGEAIPIEERNPDEVLFARGIDSQGKICDIRVANPGSTAFNPSFDVTPLKYITGFITEKGIIKPSEKEIINTFGH